MPALPKADSSLVQGMADQYADFLSAYNVCLEYEKEVATDADKPRYIRILGFLLLYAPSYAVRTEVARSIHSRGDDNVLAELGAFFERNVIVPFKKHRGRTPKPSDHPSRPSFEVMKNQMKVDIIETHHEAKHWALVRDVSYPVSSMQPHPMTLLPMVMASHLQSAGIFFNLESKTGGNDNKSEYSASILAVLKRFRYDIKSFSGRKVHSLTNVMTMEYNIHDAFDRLELYFEAIPCNPHQYNIKLFDSMRPIASMRKSVTLSTTNPELPLPDPALLALHATCCKVAHFSGAAEHIDRNYRDADEIDVLAEDGTSESRSEEWFPAAVSGLNLPLLTCVPAQA